MHATVHYTYSKDKPLASGNTLQLPSAFGTTGIHPVRQQHPPLVLAPCRDINREDFPFLDSFRGIMELGPLTLDAVNRLLAVQAELARLATSSSSLLTEA